MKNETAGRAPSTEELQTAIDMIIERVDTDQIILFGSAARGEMTAESDVDLLVVRSATSERACLPHDRWECSTTGTRLDVIVTNRERADYNRLSAAFIEGRALEEGRTIYTRDGAEPLSTGPPCIERNGWMVKTTVYRPDQAENWAEEAQTRLEWADFMEKTAHKCETLQASMERALKALVVAQGDRLEHDHDLTVLWRQAEAHGERIPARPDPEELKLLSRYAGDLQYPLDPKNPELANLFHPDKTWAAMEEPGRAVVAYASQRVPKLVQQTHARLEAQGPTLPH